MSDDEKKQLLSDVKNYLDITYEDEDVDKKLSGIIERGTSYLNKIAGVELVYTGEDTPKELLLDYCRYARNGALEYFKTNFKSALVSLRLEKEIELHGTETTADV